MEMILVLVVILIAFIALRFINSARVYKKGAINSTIRKVQYGLAALGLIMLISIGFGTANHFNEAYQKLENEMMISVPSMPAISAPKYDENHSTRPFEKGTVLVHTIAVDALSNPLGYAETNKIQWPEHQNKPLEIVAEIDGAEFTIKRTFNDIQWTNYHWRDHSVKNEYLLKADGSFECHFWDGMSGGGMDCTSMGEQLVQRSSVGLAGGRLFSVASTSGNEHIRFIHFITPVQDGDNLKKQPISEFLADRREWIADIDDEYRANRFLNPQIQNHSETPRTLLLIANVGAAGIILFLSAIFIALPFRKWKMATVVSTVVVILYVVVLDYACHIEHLNKLHDSSLSDQVRIFAAKSANQTFFHHGIKRDAFKSMLEEENMPQSVREAIYYSALNCQEPELYDYSDLDSQILRVLLKNNTERNNETLQKLDEENDLFIWRKDRREVFYFMHTKPVNGVWKHPVAGYMVDTGNGKLGEGDKQFSNRRMLKNGTVVQNIRVDSIKRSADQFEIKYEISKHKAKRLKVDYKGVQTATMTYIELMDAFVAQYLRGGAYSENDLCRFLMARSDLQGNSNN